jgi:ankyrin repeat protein
MTSVCSKQMTALHYAAKYGYKDMVEQLLAADDRTINSVDNSCRTPLHLATCWDHTRVITKLLARGANCNLTDSTGQSPFNIACRKGLATAAKMLLPSVSRSQLEEGFHQVYKSGSVELLALLLDAGIDINLEDGAGGKGYTALETAAFFSRPRLVQLLLIRRADLEKRDLCGITPLMAAVRGDAVECLKLLVDAGANPNTEDRFGYNSIYYATIWNRPECVLILLKAKADLRVPARVRASHQYSKWIDLALWEFKQQAFELVLDRGQISSDHLSPTPDVLRRYLESDACEAPKLKALLDKVHGWDPNQDISEHGTMLHYACFLGRGDVVHALLGSKRVEFNVCNERHGTPLLLAASRADRKSSVAIVRTLLREGAETSMGSKHYGTPLHAAALAPMASEGETETWTRYLDIVGLLLAHNPSSINVEAGIHGTPLIAAISGWMGATMVEALLQSRPNLGLRSGTSETALHVAAHQGDVTVVKLLLDQNCPEYELNIGTLDAGGRLPVHLAAVGNHPHLIDILTTPHVSLVTRDYEGRHSLHFAAGQGNVTFVGAVLARFPESVRDVDCDGWTPLHWACRQRFARMVTMLLDYGADRYARTKRGWLAAHVAMYHGFIPLLELLQTDEGLDGEYPRSILEAEMTDEQETLPVRRGQASRTKEAPSFFCNSCHCVSTLSTMIIELVAE